MYYTIGQRKGLNIGGNTNKMFVVGKNLEKNILYVSFGDDNDYLKSDSCLVTDMNFISDKRPEKATAKFRYRQKDIDVKIEYLDDGNIIVHYNDVKAVTPGQACVIYLGEECLGGGIIDIVNK